MDYQQSSQDQTTTTQTLDNWGNVIQTQVTDYANFAEPTRTYSNAYIVDANYTSRHIMNRLLQTVVSDGTHSATLATNYYDAGSLSAKPGTFNHDDANYGPLFLYRGNVFNKITPTSSAAFTYDETGQMLTSTDSAGSSVNVTPDAATNSVPGTITPNGNSNLTSSVSYMPSLAISSIAMPNGAGSNIQYDSYGRPSSSTSPYGAVTSYSYATSLPYWVQTTTNGHWIRTTLDGFSRTVRVEKGDGTGTKSIVDTVYAPCGCSPLGKLKQVSQPYAPGQTPVWTTYNYDGLGRTISIVAPDGASTTTYAYWDDVEQITDPAGHWKVQVHSVFGNLQLVREPNPAAPNDRNQDHWTYYSYDILNHLTQVSMPRGSTTQTRTFNYTTGNTVGGYLLSATNPENGTVSYTWNADGTLATKTDAKGQVFTYVHDAYKRLIQVKVGATVLRNYYYDTNPVDASFSQNAWGRLTAVQYTNGSDTYTDEYSYQAAGGLIGKRFRIDRTLPWHNGNVVRTNDIDAFWTYDNEGKTATMQYPVVNGTGGSTYTSTYDTMSRLVSNGFDSGAQYNAANQITALGGETRQYNALNQLTLISSSAFAQQYVYSATQNNGQIIQQLGGPAGETVDYQYDALNRLASAVAEDHTWGQSYVYDGFGNLTQQNVTAGSAPSMSLNIDLATNRVVNEPYDANGNLGYQPNLHYPIYYDAENRVSGALGSNDQYSYYFYNGSNQRIWKKTPAGGEEFSFYGLQGERLATFNPQITTDELGPEMSLTLAETDGYFGSKLVYRKLASGAQGGVVQDRLGSARVDSLASPAWTAYYPYGQERGSGTANDRMKFGTYRRDGDTGLDYAMNRYYLSNWGRFMSPDPYMATASGANNPANPGSWNRYTYAANDPVNFYDPPGMFAYSVPGNGDTSPSPPPAGYCDFAPLDPLCNPTGLHAFKNPQNQMNSTGQAQQQWQTASSALYTAAQFIENKKNWSTKCKKDLSDVISPKALSNGLEVDAVSQLQQAAASATFFDGTVSGTLYNTLYAGRPNLQSALSPAQQTETIEQAFASGPGTSAMAALFGNTIYVNPQQINSYGSGFLIGTVMHELLHNITGLTDPDLQSHFPNGGRGSFDISVALVSDCLF